MTTSTGPYRVVAQILREVSSAVYMCLLVCSCGGGHLRQEPLQKLHAHVCIMSQPSGIQIALSGANNGTIHLHTVKMELSATVDAASRRIGSVVMVA